MKTELDEILNILMEECAETIVACSKINRFGLESKHPLRSETNRQELTEELGDLKAMIEILYEIGVIDRGDVEKAAFAKLDKLEKYSPNIIRYVEKFVYGHN